MTQDKLITAIIREMDRVWGKDGLGGSWEEYEWLLTHYGITEEEDVQWQLILEHDMDELSPEDAEDEELMQFLNDEQAVHAFLERLLQKYRSNTITYEA